MLSRFITIVLFVVFLGSMSFGASAAGLPSQQNIPAAQATQCNNIALGKPTNASDSFFGVGSGQAVDGNLQTFWNSGKFAPQWIEINLGSPQSIDEIRMYAAQSPSGNTTHEIWVADGSKVYTKVATLTGPTINGQLLTQAFSPSLASVQWVKIMTTSSPSWVAWFEIQVCQTPTGAGTPTNTPTSTPVPGACNNIALGKPTDASASFPGIGSDQAVDGNLGTFWNSGQFAPQWIEINLGSPQTIDEIRMYTAQTPAGNTTHELWVAGSDKLYTKVATLTGSTTDRQILSRVFSPSLTSVQWVKIMTTSSPSWIAWFEIQVCQTSTGTATPTSVPTNTPTGTAVPPACNDIALNKQTIATSTLAGMPASQAVDGNLNTMWNSGAFSPQSIEINLGSPQTVDEIRMYAAQTPAGNTTHELWVAGSNKVYTKLDTITGFTVDRQLTSHPFSPALTSIQWVKVVTTASPSWVAWFEIQVCQNAVTPTVTATGTATATSTATATPTNTPVAPPACNNIALNKPAFATTARTGMPASQAVDGNLSTMWNAGAFPPQSIEIDLGSPQTIDEIRMYAAQTPAGNTTHELWVAGSNKVYTKLDTVSGFTVDRQLTRHPFSPALTSIQWVKVVTTSSPSWVAWFEIQVCQTPTGTVTPTSTATGTATATSTATSTVTSTPTGTVTTTPVPQCNDIAVGKQADAAASLPGMPASQAVDGNLSSMWNSGLFAPQSIEINLGSPQTVDEIRMYAAQTPAGNTTHELWVAGSDKVYTKLDTVSGFTVDHQLTRHPFSPALTSIQWVKVVTTASPSWVAWFEIQVCQTPPVTITPTSTGTITPTLTPTFTPTSTGTITATSTPSSTPTGSQTSTATATSTGIATTTSTATGTPGTNLPDLTITNMRIELQNPSCFISGDPLGVRLTVANIGQGAAGSFVARVNNVDQTVNGLGAGQTTTLFFTGYSNPVTATVDATNLIAESNENNNTLTEMVPIPTPPLPCTTTTATATATSTATPTGTAELGQLKLCEESVSGIPNGQTVVVKVNTVSYNVPVGYCILAGTYPLNSQPTIQETIPAGYTVSGISVLPSARLVSQNNAAGKVVVKIGTGVTEVLYQHVATTNATGTATPTNTPTSTPSCSPNCTPTPTPIPTGRMQICKEADGVGVTGDFVFRYNSRSKTVPVGACSLITSIDAGTLTITEDAKAGYAVSDIYTIPADRLVSKDINSRTVTVTIVPGNASTQTIVVFVNKTTTITQAVPQDASLTYSASPDDIRMIWLGSREAIMSSNPKLQYARLSTYN